MTRTEPERTRRIRARAAVAAAFLGLAAGVPVPVQDLGAFVPLAAAAAGVERFVISPQESSATYRVPETFLEANQLSVAVGTTHVIRGEVTLDRASPRTTRIGPITVDISTLRSDRGRRDEAIRKNWLESERFPTAEFIPTEITGLPQTYVEGQTIPLVITGTLRIHDTVRPAAFAASAVGILKAQNKADLELNLTAHRMP